MNRESLIKQLIVDEGLILTLYKCTAGRNTVGVGHNIDDNPLTAPQLRRLGIPANSTKREVINILSSRGITKDEALYLLDNDIDLIYDSLKAAIPWLVNKPSMVQEALCNMCFNLGLAGLLKFKKTLALIKADKYDEAAIELLRSKWASQVGIRATRISNALKSV